MHNSNSINMPHFTSHSINPFHTIYISHKWSHTETICPTQSQSRNLTTLHIISGSYSPSSACPSHIFSFFLHVTTTGTIRLVQFQISHSVKAICQFQPHYHTCSSPFLIIIQEIHIGMHNSHSINMPHFTSHSINPFHTIHISHISSSIHS